jgi:hypothetical protein
MPVDSADVQALEHALTITEQERDESRRDVGRLSSLLAGAQERNVSLRVAVAKVELENRTLEDKLAAERDRDVVDVPRCGEHCRWYEDGLGFDGMCCDHDRNPTAKPDDCPLLQRPTLIRRAR